MTPWWRFHNKSWSPAALSRQ